MKWFRPSLVSRQLIILSLIVALLWINSKPVPGADGRIECVSTDYPKRIPFPRLEPYKIGSTFTLHVFLNNGAKPIASLKGIPITKSYILESNEFLIDLCGYFPSLRNVRQINDRLHRRWIFHFGLLPSELEILANAKRNNYDLMFLPDNEFLQ